MSRGMDESTTMNSSEQRMQQSSMRLDPTEDAFNMTSSDAPSSDVPSSGLQPRQELDSTKLADAAFHHLGSTYFIGIGGAGMSVLAEMLHQEGVQVSGSDSSESSKTQRLEALGIPVHIGQSAQNLQGVDTVVWSSAIKSDNPEIMEARRQHRHLVHRSDILGLLMSRKRAVSVAGAHGKTTTSALLSHVLTHAAGSVDKLGNPSYAIGGSVQGVDGPIDGGHADTGSVFVAEADESDGSFLKYRPEIAIVTNAEADHLDHYGTVEAYRQAFVAHASHAKAHVVITGDDAGARDIIARLDAHTAQHTVVYTTGDGSRFAAFPGCVVRIVSESERQGSGEERFSIIIPPALADGEERSVAVALKIPGIHNARNATAAIIAAMLLGMDVDAAAAAAASFLGAVRRFQVWGSVNQVTVVDDYAHHPTEIAALLDAARRRYPSSRIHIIFQPHLFSRTQFFAPAFAEALHKADDVMVTGIFPAREKQSDFPDVGPQSIVKAAQTVSDSPAHAWISAVDNMNQAAQMIAMRAQPGDVVITAGAGDINAVVPVILHVLEARESPLHDENSRSAESGSHGSPANPLVSRSHTRMSLSPESMTR
ncbi:UDP-N-acetylmuramate--L-alanine ligase [Bifidobacterium aquikefiricola]|uniref:UDP-N-acetylmuramate--L-alanine ligase n=1 Tax=Bifidobacterium aquikefiricola TaxID=3059038 RepID=A0AB39U926_9BIFI